MIWNVTQITVEAHYASNDPTDILTVACQSVTEIPGGYKNDVPGSRFEYPRLIARGLDSPAMQNLNRLKPYLTRLLFHDQETGGEHEYPIQLLDTSEDTATFVVHH